PHRLADPARARGQHRGAARPPHPRNRSRPQEPVHGREGLTMAAAKKKKTSRGYRTTNGRSARPQRLAIYVATRKGVWIFRGDAARRAWRVEGPHFLGHTVHHVVLDPRDRRTVVAAGKTGHLGPTMF